MLRRTSTLVLAVTVALAGCAKKPVPPREPREPEKAPPTSAAAEGGAPAADAVQKEPGAPEQPEAPEEPQEPEEPEPPAGPPGELVVHGRGDIGVTVHRKGEKVAEGKAVIPIPLPPAHYTVKIQPPGLPEAELGRATVLSEKTTDVEITGYGEIWVHASRAGEPAQLVDEAGRKVAEGKTCDYWLVPAGKFTVRALDVELEDVVVESGKMTSVAVGK